MQAGMARVLGHPLRLRVLHLIGGHEVAYGALLDRLTVPKANLSQHLAVLRRAGIVAVRRDGAHVYYRLTLPEITQLCASMRAILDKHLAERDRPARTALAARVS
jgi:ArsR family transcriptional regulator